MIGISKCAILDLENTGSFILMPLIIGGSKKA